MILIKCLRPLIAPLRSAANHSSHHRPMLKETENRMHVEADPEIHGDPNRIRVGNQGTTVHTQFSEFVTFHLLLLYYLLSFWAVTVVAVAVMAVNGVKGFAVKSCIV